MKHQGTLKGIRWCDEQRKGRDRMTGKEQKLLSEYTEEIEKIYGNSLRYVILYGSRARGDFREDSDYDIMVLVDLSDKEIKSLEDHKLDVDCKYFNQYDDVGVKSRFLMLKCPIQVTFGLHIVFCPMKNHYI